jgi:hypothetical protein
VSGTLRPVTYRAAARRLRHYASQLEQYARPADAHELAALTRAIHAQASTRKPCPAVTARCAREPSHRPRSVH